MNKKIKRECESSCEYVLPDYLGDVKRLLCTSALAVPAGQFTSDGVCECTGLVVFGVMYIDAENKLSSAEFTADYGFTLSLDDDAASSAFVTASVATYSVRLTGPRKMSARAGVCAEATVAAPPPSAAAGSAFEEPHKPELLSKTVRTACILTGELNEREYAEEAITLEGVAADEIEIIASNAVVKISEATPVDGGVNIKGTLIVTAIIRTPEAGSFAIRREIPFDETVSILGAEPDMGAIADATVSSVTCGVSENESAATISANAILELKAMVCYNVESEIVADGYLKESETEAKYERLSYREHVASLMREESVSLKFPRSEVGLEHARDVLCLACSFKNVRVEAGEKDSRITAEAALSGVACEINEDGSRSCVPVKASAPVSLNVNVGCQIPDGAELSVRLSSADCEWSIDPESLTVKCSFTESLSAELDKSCERLALLNATGSDEEMRRPAHIRVYYPDKDESLFAIAKKFRTTVAELARDNSIAEATSTAPELAAGFTKLMIR